MTWNESFISTPCSWWPWFSMSKRRLQHVVGFIGIEHQGVEMPHSRMMLGCAGAITFIRKCMEQVRTSSSFAHEGGYRLQLYDVLINHDASVIRSFVIRGAQAVVPDTQFCGSRIECRHMVTRWTSDLIQVKYVSTKLPLSSSPGAFWSVEHAQATRRAELTFQKTGRREARGCEEGRRRGAIAAMGRFCGRRGRPRCGGLRDAGRLHAALWEEG
ncbi:hypothetical protein CERZMDRAFT_86030 [Cercospora zeae-maydis SCOH1-5]|uniref:Uncharacterized protein n=1 Tax=Cercospora zeae-maydis SCOH1-5 TaxID=717836 RepID=A0A6A6FBJ6_9PEZI|nr:hypothetical protein CERZMDRAFT_86030 [Cercospora zeae-maydis SCOH1-5]